MESERAARAQSGMPLSGMPGEPRPPATRTTGYPFRGPGLAARVLPFAVLAVLAEASLALPPGSASIPPTIASVVLLFATAAAFALPWARLPSWAPVLVPLLYAGSVLALTIAAGSTSGVAIVALMPVVWTALFHRRWESACVVVAVVTAVIACSLVPTADPAVVIVRRLVFWAAVGALISVATQGLRGRIRRAQSKSARLQERLREVSLRRDRDRIASDLQDRVIQRVFSASLSLQAALALAGDTEVSRRIESATRELDEATRLVRQSIFGLRGPSGGSDLRRGVLQVCGEFAGALGTTPDVSFSGAMDGKLPERTAAQMLEALRETLTAVGEQAGPAQVAVAVSDHVRLTVTLRGRWPPAGQDVALGLAETLREGARQIGAAVEIGSDADGGTRLAWQFSDRPGGLRAQTAVGD
jgi:signal transduction histidine kinase